MAAEEEERAAISASTRLHLNGNDGPHLHPVVSSVTMCLVTHKVSYTPSPAELKNKYVFGDIIIFYET